MDIDRSSLAAAALYDMKHEQLQIANVALQQQQQQQLANERHSQEVAKTQETQITTSTTTDQALTNTDGDGQTFVEEGLLTCNHLLLMPS